MTIKRGLFRLWLALSSIWIVVIVNMLVLIPGQPRIIDTQQASAGIDGALHILTSPVTAEQTALVAPQAFDPSIIWLCILPPLALLLLGRVFIWVCAGFRRTA